MFHLNDGLKKLNDFSLQSSPILSIISPPMKRSPIWRWLPLFLNKINLVFWHWGLKGLLKTNQLLSEVPSSLCEKGTLGLQKTADQLDSTLWTTSHIILDRLSCRPQISTVRLMDRVMQILGPLVGVTTAMVPAMSSNSNFEGWYLNNYLIRVKNTFSKSDLHYPNKQTVQVLIWNLVPL